MQLTLPGSGVPTEGKWELAYFYIHLISAEIHLHLKALQTHIPAFFWAIYVNRANFYQNIFLQKEKFKMYLSSLSVL